MSVNYSGDLMIHTMKKTLLGVGIIAVSASLLSACNTTQDSSTYVERTNTHVVQPTTRTTVLTEKETKVVVIKSTAKHAVMGDSNHEPAAN